MIRQLFSEGKKLILRQQTSVLSAASLIMVMIIASKVLGFIRQRVLFTYFTPQETDLFLAAFEIPDVLFEVLVFGTLSAAFIPVFSKYLSKKQEREAWYMAVSSLNVLLSIFLVLGLFVFIFAEGAYSLLAGKFFKDLIGIGGGFSAEEITTVVKLSRILLITQLFFVVSSFMTGVLESFKRFLFPALAPLVYNLGIVLGTIFLSPSLGLLGPTIGALFGAIGHLLVQAPVAYYLGFRYRPIWDIRNKGVKRLIRLSAPRVLELTVFQIKRLEWLFLGSLTAGGFTYLKSADLLQTLPIGVFGISMAKAALPTLSSQAGNKEMAGFHKTFFTTLNQILFLVIPISAFMIVLRVPVVRLVFGAEQFDWQATLQTSYTLTAFSIGTFAYASSLLISRAFYALHNTKTPVVVSIISVFLNAALGIAFVIGLRTGTWGIALAYSVAGIFQFVILTTSLISKLKVGYKRLVVPMAKMLSAAAISAVVVRLIFLTLDRWVWIKQSFFLSSLEAAQAIPFERFVFDTRYTGNLLILTVIVSLIGSALYIFVLILLKSQEVWAFFGFVRRILTKRITLSVPGKEPEQITPPPTDSTN